MEETTPPMPETRYPIGDVLDKTLSNRFVYHAPKTDQTERYAAIRAKLQEAARLICELTPDSREQSLALTNLEFAMYNANAAIARNE